MNEFSVVAAAYEQSGVTTLGMPNGVAGYTWVKDMLDAAA